MAKNLGEKEAGIFDAHLMVLEDKALIDDVVKRFVQLETMWSSVSIRLLKILRLFQSTRGYLSEERAADLKDISRRLIRNLMGATANYCLFGGSPCVSF